jgi:hypothetical protein
VACRAPRARENHPGDSLPGALAPRSATSYLADLKATYIHQSSLLLDFWTASKSDPGWEPARKADRPAPDPRPGEVIERITSLHVVETNGDESALVGQRFGVTIQWGCQNEISSTSCRLTLRSPIESRMRSWGGQRHEAQGAHDESDETIRRRIESEIEVYNVQSFLILRIVYPQRTAIRAYSGPL